MLLIGKPSISMGHGFHGYVSHNQRVIGFSLKKTIQLLGYPGKPQVNPPGILGAAPLAPRPRPGLPGPRGPADCSVHPDATGGEKSLANPIDGDFCWFYVV